MGLVKGLAIWDFEVWTTRKKGWKRRDLLGERVFGWEEYGLGDLWEED